MENVRRRHRDLWEMQSRQEVVHGLRDILLRRIERDAAWSRSSLQGGYGRSGNRPTGS